MSAKMFMNALNELHLIHKKHLCYMHECCCHRHRQVDHKINVDWQMLYDDLNEVELMTSKVMNIRVSRRDMLIKT